MRGLRIALALGGSKGLTRPFLALAAGAGFAVILPLPILPLRGRPAFAALGRVLVLVGLVPTEDLPGFPCPSSVTRLRPFGSLGLPPAPVLLRFWFGVRSPGGAVSAGSSAPSEGRSEDAG